MSLTFEWDPIKSDRNLRIREISFTEATSVFNDPLSATISDPDHSDKEDRFLIFGRSNQGRLLVVSFTDQRKGIDTERTQ